MGNGWPSARRRGLWGMDGPQLGGGALGNGWPSARRRGLWGMDGPQLGGGGFGEWMALK